MLRSTATVAVLAAALTFAAAGTASAEVLVPGSTVTYYAPGPAVVPVAPVAVTSYRYGVLPRRQVTVTSYAAPVVPVYPAPVVTSSYYVAPVTTYVAPAPVIVRRPLLRPFAPVVIYP